MLRLSSLTPSHQPSKFNSSNLEEGQGPARSCIPYPLRNRSFHGPPGEHRVSPRALDSIQLRGSPKDSAQNRLDTFLKNGVLKGVHMDLSARTTAREKGHFEGTGGAGWNSELSRGIEARICG